MSDTLPESSLPPRPEVQTVSLYDRIDPYRTRRRPTREVRIGDVGVGGTNPIRVQSMTNTDTMDTKATADQIERLADAGCEIARVTAPSIRDAENLAEIMKTLAARGVRIPVVADIHFTPNAALIASEYVQKVRINPGNYADKKRFEVREYSDAEYTAELERVAERFRPLVRRCRENGVAMRIGTNHGSLSDRIMNRFGDSPLGMVESALEFLDVCEDERYRDVVFSMKASNSLVAIQAYRLLAERLADRDPGPSYPFHLGVTEAGDALDGRIKSAIGIGALLEDGIGDTVRVSLTEDPVREIPVARMLARRSDALWAEDAQRPGIEIRRDFVEDPIAHRRRPSRALPLGPLEYGAGEPIRVELDLGPLPQDPDAFAEDLASSLRRVPEVQCEGLGLALATPSELAAIPALRSALGAVGVDLPLALRSAPTVLLGAEALPGASARHVLTVDRASEASDLAAAAHAVAAAGATLEWNLTGELDAIPALLEAALEASRAGGADRLAFSVTASRPLHGTRLLSVLLADSEASDSPIVLRYLEPAEKSDDEGLLESATLIGAALCDGLGDLVSLGGFQEAGSTVDVAYRILQGARLRTTRTEFISCPSCGRTLFDLEETTAKIKARTEHLKGVKIAIMGCIVNGPGEMADADFGYVGSGVGKITLYVGQEIVSRNIPEAEATDRLVDLIKEHGQWVEPPA